MAARANRSPDFVIVPGSGADEFYGGHPRWRSRWQKVYQARLPIGIERGGLVGPRLLNATYAAMVGRFARNQCGR